MTDYAWYDKGDGRQVYRKVPKPEPDRRSAFNCPMLIADHIEPTRSMVDGKIYDSKAALRATYMPSGNVSGDRYIEIGNEQQKPKPKAKPDRKAIRHSVQKALSQVGISTG